MNRRNFIKLSLSALVAEIVVRNVDARLFGHLTDPKLDLQQTVTIKPVEAIAFTNLDLDAKVADLEATLAYFWENYVVTPDYIWLDSATAKELLGLNDRQWKVFCKKSAGRARYERRYRRQCGSLRR